MLLSTSCWLVRTADYQRWPVQRRCARTVSSHDPPTCASFDVDSTYRTTYIALPTGEQTQIIRPPPQSLQLAVRDAPFDARTNYRDEFTAARLRGDQQASAQHAGVEPEDSVVRLVSQ